MVFLNVFSLNVCLSVLYQKKTTSRFDAYSMRHFLKKKTALSTIFFIFIDLKMEKRRHTQTDTTERITV